MFKAYCKDFWRYRYLLQNLIGRDFKLKYRRSVLGVLWSVLNPLLMNIVMVAVFSTLFASMHGQGISNFPVYLIIGQLLFTFFNDATTSAMSSMLGAAPLIKKVYIPKYIFPLEKVCFALVNCVFSFVALIIVMIFTGAPLHPTVVLAVYPLLTLFLFSLGVGLVLATLTVFFRDIMHLWSVFTTIFLGHILRPLPDGFAGCIWFFHQYVPLYQIQPAVLVYHRLPHRRAGRRDAELEHAVDLRRLRPCHACVRPSGVPQTAG